MYLQPYSSSNCTWALIETKFSFCSFPPIIQPTQPLYNGGKSALNIAKIYLQGSQETGSKDTPYGSLAQSAWIFYFFLTRKICLNLWQSYTAPLSSRKQILSFAYSIWKVHDLLSRIRHSENLWVNTRELVPLGEAGIWHRLVYSSTNKVKT